MGFNLAFKWLISASIFWFFFKYKIFPILWSNYLNALGFCDRASWANCEVREKTDKMQQLDVYY